MRITVAGAKDVLLTIIAAGGVFTLGTGALTDYGWVTQRTYNDDKAGFVRVDDFNARANAVDSNFAAQSKVNTEISGSLNEIKALISIVPKIESLLRNRCAGGRGLDETISDLKDQYLRLTGKVYLEPSCGELGR